MNKNGKNCIDNLSNSLSDSSISNWSSIENISATKGFEKYFDAEKGPNCSRLRDDENYYGFDNNVGTSWIYPINKPIRSYQLNISKSCLFKNTLVVLPTGLGKTFIAAVVMYNIYRWYPNGKIIFMAPTRPLVTQQIDACCKIMGIPKTDIAEMTGKVNRSSRADGWHSKKIFFATPQIVQRDLFDSKIDFPFKHIKLVVVDEAHKAKGKYAYVEVIQMINEINKNFRVLALSATPGRSINDVLEVIRNMLISNIEIRYENSFDVSPFIHKKSIKTVIIPLGVELVNIRDQLIGIIDPYLRALIDDEVISSNVGNMSKGWLIMEQKKFRERSMHQRHINHSKVSLNFSICISLYHALELLERHGTKVLLNYFDENNSEKEKFFINIDQNVKEFVEKLRRMTGKNPLQYSVKTMANGKIPDLPIDLDFGHPKFEKAKNILVEHFHEKPGSKAIIFCEFRESVTLMHRILLQNRPLIKPKCFVGQGGKGSLRAVTQAQQLKVLKDFREGICNTLIATSVAEEGIDVGEVDLIICFDISTKNPVRIIQRVGRTGRMRHGQVVMLVTEGKEHLILKEVLANKDTTNLKLMKCPEIKEAFYVRSPRIIPPEFDPVCVEVFMKEIVDAEKTQNSDQSTKENRCKKTHLIDTRYKKADVRDYFKKLQPNLSQGELALFDIEMKDINEKDSECVEKTILEIQEEMESVDNFCKDYVVTQFENNDENKTQNRVDTKELEKKFKKLNYMSRQLDKDVQTLDYSKNLDELIKSKVVNRSIKKHILLKNGNYVKDKLEAVKLILTVDEENNINNSSTNATNCAGKKVQEIFKLVEEVLGDQVEIEHFVKSHESKQRKKEDLIDFKKKTTKSIINSFQPLKPEKALNNINILNENFVEIDMEKFDSVDELNISNYTNKYEHLSVTKQTILSDTELDLDLQYTECDSKYASQWNQFNDFKTEIYGTKANRSPCASPTPNIFTGSSNNFKKVTSTPKMLLKEEKEFLRDITKPKLMNYQEGLGSNSVTNSTVAISDEDLLKMKHPSLIPRSLVHKIYDQNIDCEISVDLFEEDFDFVLTESEKSDKQYEVKTITNLDNCTNKITELKKVDLQNNSYSDSKKSDFDIIHEKDEKKYTPCNKGNKVYKPIENSTKTKKKVLEDQSMISISQILEIVAKKESCVKQLDMTNPELEDFDINDFAEPFEEEENYFSSPEKHKNFGVNNFLISNIENLENLNNTICCHSMSPSFEDKGVSKVNTSSNTLNNTQLIKNTSSISKKCETNINCVKIHDISPSLIKRTTSRLKLQNVGGNNETQLSFDLKLNRSGKVERKCDLVEISNTGILLENQNDSTLLIKPTKKKTQVILSSDSDLEDNALYNESQSSNVQVSTTPSKRECIKNRQRLRARRRKKFKKCSLIDEEAGCSSPDSENDDEFDAFSTVYDSVIVRDDEAENFLDSKIYLKYIQTTKSPQRFPNRGFKIPSPRQYNDIANIFSQPVEEIDDLMNCYNGSFVVNDDELIENLESQENQMSPLSKAEAILRKRKRERNRKLSNIPSVIKRRRIINDIIEISDDEIA